MARCPHCRETYTRKRMGQKSCEKIPCAIEAGNLRKEKMLEQRAREKRKAERQRALDLKPIQYWLKRTERVVNALARALEEDDPCISCGTWDALEWHAGHFIPVGRSKAIRFDLANIHKQCDECNTHKHGNVTEYEKRLVWKIGKQEVERLKAAPKTKKWTREELQSIEAEGKAKLKALRSEDVCQ